MRTTRDIFLECEWITKMTFHHFKRKRLELIISSLIQYNGLELLHKNYVFMNQ